jgi:hypothetical protein
MLIIGHLFSGLADPGILEVGGIFLRVCQCTPGCILKGYWKVNMIDVLFIQE